MLAGDREAIDRGRAYRKRLGGAMRQAGILAAAGLVALEEMPHRLGEDHLNARFFAEEIKKVRGLQMAGAVQTNILVFDISATGWTTSKLSAALKSRGVLINGIDDRRMRALTHFDVTRNDCARAAEQIAELLAPN
jgi:threonine aldolase